MLRELRKHAAYSEALRETALNKSAGLLGGMILKPLAALGKWGIKHPFKSLTIGGGVAKGVYDARSSQSQFRPEVHRAQLGIGPNGLPER